MSAAVPIRRKLSTLTLTTCGIALLITATVFLLGELHQIRRSSLQQLRTLSEAIASNSTAALAFDNPEDASGILAAFRSDPNIEVAALFKADGTFFVAYPPGATVVPPGPGAREFTFEHGKLLGVAEVREDSHLLGTLFVRSDMRATYQRLGLYALLAALVITLTLLVAWVIARRLQKQPGKRKADSGTGGQMVGIGDAVVRLQLLPGNTRLEVLAGQVPYRVAGTDAVVPVLGRGQRSAAQHQRQQHTAPGQQASAALTGRVDVETVPHAHHVAGSPLRRL
jgi:hypothetical protein